MHVLRILCILAVWLPGLLGATGTPAEPEETYLPGVTLSQGITEITGVAISPMLGVSAVGAWTYWKTPAARRAALPWYASPWIWGVAFGILTLCFLKDSLGTAVPGILKKPLDMLELFENKASALIASGAFVPLVAAEMAKHLEATRAIEVPTASLTGMAFVPLDLSWLLVPAAMLSFLVVWLCSHAVNVLIILSPFSTLDALLKLARAAVLAAVGVIYLIAPWLAAAVCLVLIAVAAWLAPSAMRLMIFGSRYAADILLPRRVTGRAIPEQPHAFTLGRFRGLPPRTGGRLVRRDDGGVSFRYRRFCLLDEREVPLPAGHHLIERGLFSPSLIHQGEGAAQSKLLIFLPRYRGQETAVAQELRFAGVRDHPVARGFSALNNWLKGMLRSSLPSEM